MLDIWSALYQKVFGVLATINDVEIKECCLIGVGKLINPLNHELNPFCYLLALLGVHHFLHVSRIMVNRCTGQSPAYATHSTLKPVPTLPL